MWIKASGDLTEHVSQLTTAVSTHLAVLGDKAALVDASIWPVREELWEKIESSFETIEYVLLTHAHFDHVGCLPYFRKMNPQLKVVSGIKTAELLSNKEYAETLRQKNLEASQAAGVEFDCASSDWFKALQVDDVLADGDSINLGEGVEVKLFETPGHTADSVSYYFKPDMALAAGESLGQYSGREKITPSFGSSYYDALKSFQKLNAFDIQLLSLPHSGVITGDLVSKYLTELPIEMERFKKSFISQLDEGQLIEEIVAKVSTEWVEEGRLPEGPFHESHRELVNQMVRNIKEEPKVEAETAVE